MQISKGGFRGELTRSDIGGWNIQQVSILEGITTCRGDAPERAYAIVVPLGPAVDVRLLGKPVTPTSLGLYAPGSEHADVMRAGAAEVVLVPPREFIDGCLTSDPTMIPDAGSHHVHRHSRPLGALRQLLGEYQTTVTTRPELLRQPGLVRSLADDLSLRLFNALGNEARQTSSGRPPLPRAAIVRRLCDRLERAGDEPIFASEICRELDVSFPTLRRIFLERYGVPPAKYLLLSRYYLARRRLRSGAYASVGDVAHSCGFWEPSRFAKAYKGLFGELPSITLRAGADGRSRPAW